MKRNPENGANTPPLQTGLTSSLLLSIRPQCSASQRLSSYITWEAASRLPWQRTGAYVADTAYLIGCCERHRYLNCNALSPFFYALRVTIIFTSKCDIMVMFGCKLLMKLKVIKIKKKSKLCREHSCHRLSLLRNGR